MFRDIADVMGSVMNLYLIRVSDLSLMELSIGSSINTAGVCVSCNLPRVLSLPRLRQHLP